MVTADFEKRYTEPVEITRSFSGGNVDEAVYCKLDWLTLVYRDCSTNEILSALGFNGNDFEEIEKAFSERVLRSLGYLTDLSFNLNGIGFSYRYADVINKVGALNVESVDMFDFFDYSFEYCRIDISGSGLDYLRSVGIDVDTNYRTFDIISNCGTLDVHITRFDTAFDFVNYKKDFLNRFISGLQSVGNPQTGVVPIIKSPTCGLKYSIHSGKETTVYLGTGKSNKLLRIYDKKKQYDTAGKMSLCPYICNGEIPDSWFRIELQCRREPDCHKVLFGGDMQSTLRFIDEYFAVCGKDRKKLICWQELFDWETLPKIIQIAKYVYKESRRVRAERYVKNTAMGNIIVCVAHNGWDEFKRWVDDRVHDLQLSDNPIDLKRWCSLRMSILSDSLHDPEFFKKNAHGLYELK